MKPTGRPQKPLESFYEPEPNSGCWLWIGSLHRNGYGHIKRLEHGDRLAHRVVYEHERGPIPEGLTLDHRCRVRSCVNPAHLEVVTGPVNTLRGVGVTAENARKTLCPRGHEYTWTSHRGKPRRYCWPCQRDHRSARKLGPDSA